MYRGAFSRRVFIVVMALICAGPLAAQAQQAPAQQPSAVAVATAREVILAKGVSGLIEPAVRGVIESVKNSFIPTNPNLTRELNDVALALHKELDGKAGDAIDQMARIYASRFTEQELKDLLAFYKSPLGQKYIKEEQIAIEESLRAANRWVEAFSETVMARMRSEMQKKGHTL